MTFFRRPRMAMIAGIALLMWAGTEMTDPGALMWAKVGMGVILVAGGAWRLAGARR